MRQTWIEFVIAVVVAAVAVGRVVGIGAQEATAGESYKNLKVLGDAPKSELIQAMFFMEGSLGVSCTYCHVSDSNFASDDKPTKLIARDMMRMVKALNHDQFGDRDVITCNTCHRGEAKPVAPLRPARVGPRQASDPAPQTHTTDPLPTVDQIFDRYVAATGGVAAQAKMTSLAMTGTKTTSEGWTAPLEFIEKAGKSQSTFQLRGAWRSSFDGQVGWSQDNFGVHPMEGKGLALFRLRASFFRPAGVRTLYTDLSVVGTEVVAGRVTYVLEGTLIGAGRQRLFFDAESARLVRVTDASHTPFGPMLEEFDVEDYRRVDAVTLPFRISDLKSDFSMIDQLDKARINGAIDDVRFEKPVVKK